MSAENIKARVEEICKAVDPDADSNTVTGALDVVHRLGRLKSGEGNNNKPRPLILRFISRTTGDLEWNHAKESEYLRRSGLLFKEDLTPSDTDARSRL